MGKDLRKEERKRNWVHKKSHTLGLFLENFIKGGGGHLPPMFLGRDHQPLPRLSKELCLIKALWRVLEKQRRLGMTSISGFPVISSLPRSSLSSSLASPTLPLLSPRLPQPQLPLPYQGPAYFFCLRPLDCPMGSGSLSPSSSATRSGNFLRFLRIYGWPGRCLCNRATRHCSVFTMQFSTWLPRQL